VPRGMAILAMLYGGTEVPAFPNARLLTTSPGPKRCFHQGQELLEVVRQLVG
jgi:hypothetical protein